MGYICPTRKVAARPANKQSKGCRKTSTIKSACHRNAIRGPTSSFLSLPAPNSFRASPAFDIDRLQNPIHAFCLYYALSLCIQDVLQAFDSYSWQLICNVSSLHPFINMALETVPKGGKGNAIPCFTGGQGGSFCKNTGAGAKQPYPLLEAPLDINCAYSSVGEMHSENTERRSLVLSPGGYLGAILCPALPKTCEKERRGPCWPLSYSR